LNAKDPGGKANPHAKDCTTVYDTVQNCQHVDRASKEDIENDTVQQGGNPHQETTPSPSYRHSGVKVAAAEEEKEAGMGNRIKPS